MTIPGKHSVTSLQKTAILGPSYIIQKVLQCETYSHELHLVTELELYVVVYMPRSRWQDHASV
jgi:hypothetical protein